MLNLNVFRSFPSIWHSESAVLLHKLEHYGIRGIVLEKFKNYLQFPKQAVKYKVTKSDSLTISYGVPQGSVLWPLLFLICISMIYPDGLKYLTITPWARVRYEMAITNLISFNPNGIIVLLNSVRLYTCNFS